MGLLLELLLTMVLSVLVAFLLGKIVSVAAPDGDDPDAPRPADGAVPPSDSGPQSSKVAAPASRVAFNKEAVSEAEAVGETGEGPHAEGRETAASCGDDCVETEEERGFEEIVHMEEEELVAEGLVLGSEGERGEESILNEADGGKKTLDSTVEETEENLARVIPEETGDVKDLSVEEKLPLTLDEGHVVNIAFSLVEASDVAKELDFGEVGTKSSKNGEKLTMVETDDVKIDPFVAGKEVEQEDENEGNEMSAEHEKIGSFFNEDDDWEGIERSYIEKLFDAATAFVGSAKGSEAVSKLSNDLQMQLYGLHKIATEGPCYESQPLALKVSARAKWHSWQRLGTMNPEMAMEKYIALLSDNIPGWMPQEHQDDGNLMEAGGHPPGKGISGLGVAFSSSQPEDQLIQKSERKKESPYCGECNVASVSQGTKQGSRVIDSSLV